MKLPTCISNGVELSGLCQERVPRWVDNMRVTDPETRSMRPPNSLPIGERSIEGAADWVLGRWTFSPTPELGSHGRILGKSSSTGEIVQQTQGPGSGKNIAPQPNGEMLAVDMRKRDPVGWAVSTWPVNMETGNRLLAPLAKCRSAHDRPTCRLITGLAHWKWRVPPGRSDLDGSFDSTKPSSLIG